MEGLIIGILQYLHENEIYFSEEFRFIALLIQHDMAAVNTLYEGKKHKSDLIVEVNKINVTFFWT